MELINATLRTAITELEQYERPTQVKYPGVNELEPEWD